MPAYDIDPAGVSQVYVDTNAAYEQFGGHTTALSGGCESAATQSGSDLVAVAIAGLITAQTPSLEFAYARTGACFGAADQALTAYGKGDAEMAASAVSAAAAAPVPDLPGPR